MLKNFPSQDVTKDDGKKYSCTASNSQGEKATGHILLRAIEPPKISPFTFDGDLKEGDRSQVDFGDNPKYFCLFEGLLHHLLWGHANRDRVEERRGNI